MTRHIRIPGVVDLILTDDPQDIRELAAHDALDRGFGKRGPLINRLLSGRLRRALRFERAPLPSALMRGDAKRQQTQKDLRQRFTPGQWDTHMVATLAGYVRGEGTRPVGQLAQDVVGRMFQPTYQANDKTWEAAEAIEDHLRARNPIKRLYWALTGRLPRAQDTLGRAVRGDAGAVHGTGVAIHNLVESLKRMREVWSDADQRARHTPEQAARRVLAGPRAVMRAGARDTDVTGGTLSPTTLVVLQTRDAADKALDTDLAFLSDSWSGCPADRWVVALLAEIWRVAGEEQV